MSDWQVGDLAVCVDASELNPGTMSPSVLREGVVYTVAGITPLTTWKGGGRAIGLILAEVRQPQNEQGDFFEPRFRKIRHDEHEACEEEFVTLLKRVKPKVSA